MIALKSTVQCVIYVSWQVSWYASWYGSWSACFVTVLQIQSNHSMWMDCFDHEGHCMLNDVPCMLLMDMFRDMFMFMSIYRWQSHFGTGCPSGCCTHLPHAESVWARWFVIILSLPHRYESKIQAQKTKKNMYCSLLENASFSSIFFQLETSMCGGFSS